MKAYIVLGIAWLSLAVACRLSEPLVATEVVQTLDAGTRIAASLAPSSTPSPSRTPTASATLTPTPSLTPTASATETPTLSATFQAMNIDEYPGFTVYWARELWENAIYTEPLIEDFESDAADYGELSFPFLTGNGFFLDGESSAQILSAPELLPTGNLLHFRDWGDGLKFTFPEGALVQAFAFDDKSSEGWQLLVLSSEIPLRQGRAGFVGIIVHEGSLSDFTLSSTERVQGGLTIDNIRYIPVEIPEQPTTPQNGGNAFGVSDRGV